MTNKEMMDAFGIHTCTPAYDPDAEATVEFLKNIIDLTKDVGKETDKYRWHKIPDIPEEGHLVIIVVTDYENDSQMYYMLREYKKEMFLDVHDNGYFIRGWKYVELLED